MLEEKSYKNDKRIKDRLFTQTIYTTTTITISDNMGKKKTGRCEFCHMRTTVERVHKLGHYLWLCSGCKK